MSDIFFINASYRLWWWKVERFLFVCFLNYIDDSVGVDSGGCGGGAKYQIITILILLWKLTFSFINAESHRIFFLWGRGKERRAETLLGFFGEFWGFGFVCFFFCLFRFPIPIIWKQVERMEFLFQYYFSLLSSSLTFFGFSFSFFA